MASPPHPVWPGCVYVRPRQSGNREARPWRYYRCRSYSARVGWKAVLAVTRLAASLSLQCRSINALVRDGETIDEVCARRRVSGALHRVELDVARDQNRAARLDRKRTRLNSRH